MRYWVLLHSSHITSKCCFVFWYRLHIYLKSLVYLYTLFFIYPICIPSAMSRAPSFGAAMADRRLCLSGKRTAAMLPDSFKSCGCWSRFCWLDRSSNYRTGQLLGTRGFLCWSTTTHFSYAWSRSNAWAATTTAKLVVVRTLLQLFQSPRHSLHHQICQS